MKATFILAAIVSLAYTAPSAVATADAIADPEATIQRHHDAQSEDQHFTTGRPFIAAIPNTDNFPSRPDHSLDRRGGQTYIPHWCTNKNFANCKTPLWNVGQCYNMASLGIDNAVSSFQIPPPLNCEVFNLPNCQWPQGQPKDSVTGRFVASEWAQTFGSGSQANLGAGHGGWWNDRISSVICRI